LPVSAPHDHAVLVTKADAARLLGVSRWTVDRLIKRGVLRQLWLAEGMHPRLRRADVLALTREDSS
jgi:excisionase family DNA binding protein